MQGLLSFPIPSSVIDSLMFFVLGLFSYILRINILYYHGCIMLYYPDVEIFDFRFSKMPCRSYSES